MPFHPGPPMQSEDLGGFGSSLSSSASHYGRLGPGRGAASGDEDEVAPRMSGEPP